MGDVTIASYPLVGDSPFRAALKTCFVLRQTRRDERVTSSQFLHVRSAAERDQNTAQSAVKNTRNKNRGGRSGPTTSKRTKSCRWGACNELIRAVSPRSASGLRAGSNGAGQRKWGSCLFFSFVLRESRYRQLAADGRTAHVKSMGLEDYLTIHCPLSSIDCPLSMSPLSTALLRSGVGCTGGISDVSTVELTSCSTLAQCGRGPFHA